MVKEGVLGEGMGIWNGAGEKGEDGEGVSREGAEEVRDENSEW